MREKVVPGPLATIDSIFILFVSGVYLYTTKGFTGFQSLLLGILIIIGFNILLRIKYVGTVILFLSSFIWAFGIFSLLPLEKWVNNSLPWKIAVFIILFLLSLAFHFKPVDESKDFTPEQVAALNAYDRAVELSKMQKKIQKEQEKEKKKNDKKALRNHVRKSKGQEGIYDDNGNIKLDISQMSICPVLSKHISDDNLYFNPFYRYIIIYYDVANKRFLTNEDIKSITGFNSQTLDCACNDTILNNYSMYYISEGNVCDVVLNRSRDDYDIHGVIYADLAKNKIMNNYGSSLMTSKAFMSRVSKFLGGSFYCIPFTNDTLAIFDTREYSLDSIKSSLNNVDDNYNNDIFFFNNDRQSIELI